MRVLLDEGVPRSLRSALPGHTLMGVSQMGWSGFTDAELVRRAAPHFDYLITIERRALWRATAATPSPIILVLQSPAGTAEALAPLMGTAHALIAQVPNLRYVVLASQPIAARQSGGFTLPRKLATNSNA